ncbi:MAG: hypothetical protein FJZ87_17060 [Chloroflexi bacterium]|nr:hypothetical protein [Chloroflexota bacterium]
MHRNSRTPTLLLTTLLIAISSCAPISGDDNPALPEAELTADEPTETAVATSTSSAITPKVPPTATPTDTPAPQVVDLLFTKNAFCRRGPSTKYFDVGSFSQGDTAQAEGRNDIDPRWLYVRMSNGEGHCWVSATTVQPNPEADLLPVQQPQVLLPQTPSDIYVDRICKQGGFAVTLNWTPAWEADGYYVYLNEELIQDITNPGQTSYVIKLPMNQPVSYALQAYNHIGYGEQNIIYDAGCP